MIAKIPFSQLLNDLEAINNWLELLNISTKTTRFRTLHDNVQIINSEFQEKGTVITLDPVTVYYSLTEVNAFSTIYEAFKSDPNHLPKRKLRESLSGPFFAKEEIAGSGNVNPRNHLFELELAARFILHGFKVTGFDDINFDFGDFTICVQCKRPQSIKNMKSNLDDAYDQLKRVIFEENTKGLIAISMEKVFDIDNKVLPITDEKHIDSVVENYINNFRKEYQWTWREILNRNVLAIMPIMRFISMVEPERLPTSTCIINVIPLFPSELVNAVNDRVLRDVTAKLNSGLNQIG